MLATALLISALTVVMFHHIKRSLPVRYARRVVVQNKLRQFAIDNRAEKLTLVQIEEFWAQTSKTYSICGLTSIDQLRNDLRYHSLLLLKTTKLLEGPLESDERHSELVTLHAHTVQWFSAALVEMDTLFIDTRLTTISMQDVWGEFLRMVFHSTRA